MDGLTIPDELFGTGDPIDLLLEDQADHGCSECGAGPTDPCTRTCPARDTTTRGW